MSRTQKPNIWTDLDLPPWTEEEEALYVLGQAGARVRCTECRAYTFVVTLLYANYWQEQKTGMTTSYIKELSYWNCPNCMTNEDTRALDGYVAVRSMRREPEDPQRGPMG